ncbi:MAG: FAD-dependent oxidoreductase [Firmicutes bacterium]|nr:FAD-dependent oxidoreductase [Bacillota bacterium]
MQTVKKFYFDVVICGGGPSGCAAAIAAGRSGKRAILLEMRESLGGLCTNGYITGLAGVVAGIGKEWLERLDAEGHAVMKPHLPTAEPEYGKQMLEEMVLQSGTRILYGTHVVDCIKEDNKIKSVIAYTKSGKIEVEGKVFIDATGDADLALAADVPLEAGNAEFCGLNQSVTMGFRLAYVNLKEYNEANAAWRKHPDFDPNDPKKRSLIVYKEHVAYQEGRLHEILSPGNIVYPMPSQDQTCMDVTLDATHTFDCHNTDVEDLTRQIVDQHRKVIWFHNFLKNDVPGFENSVLEAYAPMNGVRDSRHIIGEYLFKDTDLGAAMKFEDGIYQHTEFYDTHVPTPGFHTAHRHIHANEPVENAICRPTQDAEDYMYTPLVRPLAWEVRTDPRKYGEIPFRSLIAKGVDNLMATGRCMSAEYHAIGSIRVIGPSMGMGQAAGYGASLFIDQKLDAIRDLDGRLVRQMMIDNGVDLNNPPGGYWKVIREFEGEVVVSAADMCEIRNSKGQTPPR